MDTTATQTWMKAASAVVIGFGLIVASAAWPPISGLMTLLADIVIWPLDGMQNLGSVETRVVCAIGGGVMCGWGLTLWRVAEHVVPVNPAAARAIAMTGIYGWFAVDSLGSVLAGAPLNAVLNISFVALFLWVFRSGGSGRTERSGA